MDLYYKKNKIWIFLFIVSLAFIFAQYTGVFKFDYYQQYFIAMFWILIAGINICFKKNYNYKYKSDIKFYFKLFFTPWILIWIKNSMVYLAGQGYQGFLSTSINSLITMTIVILFAFSTLYLFKEKVLKYSIIAIAINFIIIFINAVIVSGPFVIFTTFSNIILGESTKNLFEVSDITFAAGLLLIIHIFNKKRIKNQNKYLLFSAFIVIIGFKRIQVIAIIFIILIAAVLKINKKTGKNILMNLISSAVIIINYMYIYIMVNGIFEKIISFYNINTMGRSQIYSFLEGQYNFSYKYFGRGYLYCEQYLKTFTKSRYSVFHSDILRVYIEMGFIFLGIWLIYYFFIARKKIEKKYGIEEAEQFFLLTIYLFILHLTDNTLTYFVTQYLYMIIPFCMYVIKNNNKEVKYNERKNN